MASSCTVVAVLVVEMTARVQRVRLAGARVCGGERERERERERETDYVCVLVWRQLHGCVGKDVERELVLLVGSVRAGHDKVRLARPAVELELLRHLARVLELLHLAHEDLQLCTTIDAKRLRREDAHILSLGHPFIRYVPSL